MLPDNTSLRVELEIVRGRARETHRPVEVPAFLIGASRDCDLVLAAPRFPDVYAYLIVHAGGVSVRHLGLAPNLYVNGVLAANAELADGDRLAVDPYEFVIHICEQHCADEPNAAPTRPLPTHTWTKPLPESEIEPMLAAIRLVNEIRAALNPPPRDAIRRPA